MTRRRLTAIAGKIEGRNATSSVADCSFFGRLAPLVCAPAGTRANRPTLGNMECGRSQAGPEHGEISSSDVSIETHRRVKRLEELAEIKLVGSGHNFTGEYPQLCPGSQLDGMAVDNDITEPLNDGEHSQQFCLDCDSTLDLLSTTTSCGSMSALWEHDDSLNSAGGADVSDKLACTQDHSLCLSERQLDRVPMLTPPAHSASQALFSINGEQKMPCHGQKSSQPYLKANGSVSEGVAHTSADMTACSLLEESDLSCGEVQRMGQDGCMNPHDNSVYHHHGSDHYRAGGPGGNHAEESDRRRLLLLELEWTRNALESRKKHLKGLQRTKISSSGSMHGPRTDSVSALHDAPCE